MNTKSLNGSQYFFYYLWMIIAEGVGFLIFKPEAFKNFKKFKALAEKQNGCCTDRGGEVCYNEFATFYEENGILREVTSPYMPEQNDIVEQKYIFYSKINNRSSYFSLYLHQ